MAKRPNDEQSLADEFDAEADGAVVGDLRRRLERWKSRAKDAERTAADVTNQLAILEGALDLDPSPPKWPSPKRPKRSSAVIVAMLSDLHLDEVVDPAEVGGLNEFNRDIAVARLRTWAEAVAALPDTGPTIDVEGLVVLWGGDMISGDIHEELAQSNADTTLGTLLFWSEQLAAALTLLAETYGRIHVPVVVGNHGRRTRKQRFKGRVRDNFDWHLAHLVARLTPDEVTWQIGEEFDALFDVMGHRHVLTHGDQFRGGGGIGGIWPPIMRGVARKSQNYQAQDRPFSHVWLGHWHQVTFGQQFTVNGSLKGWDEYAAGSNFAPEPPAQVVGYVTDVGIEWRTRILV